MIRKVIGTAHNVRLIKNVLYLMSMKHRRV